MMDLLLNIDTSIVYRFYPLIENGYWTRVISGTTILDFLVKGLALDPDYVENRIQTIFLNHKPVDDIASATLAENDRIAFSAAMPGLLGATLRKAGSYSAMRKNISHHNIQGGVKPTSDTPNSEIWILVKFFNLITKEIGPDLLTGGIWVAGDTLRHHLSLNSIAIKDKIHQIEMNAQPSSFESVLKKIEPHSKVHLKIRI